MSDQIEHEVLVHAPIARVWDLLTQPRHVARWYAFDGADMDLRAGGAIVFRWKEHGAFHGRVERATPPTFLAFRFAGHVPDEEPRPGNSTLVEFRLREEGSATLVRVVESGFDALSCPHEEGVARSSISLEGWRGGLEALRSYASEA